MIFFGITLIFEIIKSITQYIENERRYLDTLELYLPSIYYDYDYYEPSIVYDLYEPWPSIDYNLYEPSIDYDFYEPSIDYDYLCESSIDYDDLYESSIDNNEPRPSIDDELYESQPSIDYELCEPQPSMDMVPMVPTPKPRKRVRKRKVTNKSQNVDKTQVSKDNTRTRRQMPRPSKHVREKKAPNVGNAQVSRRSQKSSRQATVATRPLELIDLLSVPSNWSRKSDKYEVHEEELKQNNSERIRLCNKFLSRFSCENITRITRVQNPFLYHRYQLRKEEYKARGIRSKEQTLLHDTSQSHVNSILENNLDWRLVKRYKFGKGVSFSPDPMYANSQSSRKNGSHRALIVAKVLVGRSHIGNYNKLPKGGYSTTTGNGTKVYVKYYDDEFYPEYVIYYN